MTKAAMKVVAVDAWVARTKRLLVRERDEEIQAVQQELRTLSDQENPNVLVNMTLAQLSTGLFGRSLLRFAFPSHHLQRPKPHAFTVGDLVQIRVKAAAAAKGSTASYPTGIVARVEETAISIALGEGEDVDEEQLLSQSGGGICIDRLVNNATFVKISNALDQLAKFDYGEAQSVVDVVFSGKMPAWQTPLPAITPFNEGLNDSQLDAIRFALASKDLTLIHGPPGTGKTTTVVEFILQAVKTFKMKVLVCAPSNIAVDNVLEKMAAADRKLQLTRVGHPARLLPQILKYCLDARIQSAEGTEIVNDIRKEMQQMETQLKKTRATSARYQLRRDLKANRKEIRQREQKVVVELLKHSDVVFATNVGASSKLLKDVSFDLVVIDEAAQALEASCWIPILKAKRCVLAGDHLQLPPTIKSKAAAASGLETTLFDRVTQFGHTQEIVKMLKIQYRMHEDISDWSSKAMYKGELQSYEGVAKRKLHQLPHMRVTEDDDLLNSTLLLIDTAGCDLEEDADDEDDKNTLLKLSKSNTGEARVVAKHVQRLLEAGLKTEEVAVITPYNKQVQLLKGLLLERYPTLEIRSVDGFQGCEKEAVVMSLVRSNAANEVGFLADERRMNVAVTRAKRHVALVCDTDTIRANAFLKRMVEHFEEHGEYRSAQEYLEDEVVRGQGRVEDAPAKVPTDTAKQKQEKPKSKEVAPAKPKGSKAASGASEKEHKESSLETLEPHVDDVEEKTAAKAETTPLHSQSTESADEESEERESESEEQPQKSVFSMLDDSSSSSSESERDEGDGEGATSDDLAAASSLLRELHMSRLARQPPPAPVPAVSSGGGKKSKGKKKKGKSKSTGSAANGTAAAVEERQDDEDDLAFLTRQAEQSNRCCFQGASARCKKSVTMLGAVCKLCKLKFCYDHAQPEVHGCGAAIRQLERQQFQARATQASVDAKKLGADMRKLLQKKLGDKVSEQTASRKARAKPKK